jgi:hypothetical protein
MEDRKRKIQAEDGKYLCVGIVDGEVDKTPIIAVNSRTGKRRQFELSTFARTHEKEVASGEACDQRNGGMVTQETFRVSDPRFAVIASMRSLSERRTFTVPGTFHRYSDRMG